MSLIPHDLTPVYKATIAKGTSAIRYQRPTYINHLPPCNNTCPAGLNIQAWLALAQAGRYEQAWHKYMEDNPLPATHGRACYHPCEGACNRQFLDQPVAIHSLDRFLGDLGIEKGWTITAGAPTAKRVLVIGAGPAGLSCAYHLRRFGHAVEIRDSGDEPGGMMRYGIPAYRLPRDIITKEIARIEAMGVKIACNHRVTDVLAEQAQGGFDAVFVAIGTHIANHLGVPARDGAKMIDAISLLEQVEKGHAPVLGRVVGIIGGGDTAMDAARVAKRLGADETLLIYRSDKAHMKAQPYEAMEAVAEGVKIKWLSTVKQFDRDEVLIERMAMTPEGCVATGRFERLKTNALVLAIGEHADIEFLKTAPGVAVGRGDVVEVDAAMSTGRRGIFAGGDLIGGARTMTTAVGHGKKAARNIDAFLRRQIYLAPEKHPIVPFEALNPPVFLDAARQEAPEVLVSERKGFEEVAEGLTQAEARFEAGRCLSCGNCFECDNCYAACPEQAIVRLGPGRGYRIDYDLCSGCAVCFEQCPCHAIEMIPEPATEIASGLIGEPTSPSRFKVRP